MSRPTKHPKTGVYLFRKVVPEDLRAIIGKTEEKRSLGTKDMSEAKVRHAAVAAEVEMRWRALRAKSDPLSKPEPLSHRQIVALAGEEYRSILGRMQDDPGEADVWGFALHAGRIRGEESEEALSGSIADALLLRKGIATDDDSRARLIRELAKAHQQVAQLLKRNAEGDYRPDPDAARFPELNCRGRQIRRPIASVKLLRRKGGMGAGPGGIVAGIKQKTLDAAIDADAVDENTTMKNMTAQQAATLYRYQVDYCLGRVGGSAALDGVGDKQAAAALCDTLFQFGDNGGADVIRQAVDAVTKTSSVETGRLGKTYYEKFCLLAQNPQTRQALSDALAEQREIRARHVNGDEIDVNRIQHFTFK
ncbi:MAG TPA: DUF6538 domain-containing protein [Candidatus Sulfotelmatobacter sp.]|jgi:hypothetical protein|nr:DUF6538 domain-containing protein [Candidatus Sulfotelmatobacter sp.]